MADEDDEDLWEVSQQQVHSTRTNSSSGPVSRWFFKDMSLAQVDRFVFVCDTFARPFESNDLLNLGRNLRESLYCNSSSCFPFVFEELVSHRPSIHDTAPGRS